MYLLRSFSTASSMAPTVLGFTKTFLRTVPPVPFTPVPAPALRSVTKYMKQQIAKAEQK